MKVLDTLSSVKLGFLAAFIGTVVVVTASALPVASEPDNPVFSEMAKAGPSGTQLFVEDIIRP